jgi:beta-glucosidase
MSQDQKLAMVHGTGSGTYVGQVPAIPSLGIPALNLEDGPAGVADRMTGVTAFPAPITIASSWDTVLAQEFATAMGEEQAGKGTNVVLGPMMNMDRLPEDGRNFEGFGEDPVLAAAMAGAIVRGIQSQGLVATAKHYVDNDQETDRTSVSAVIDDRTQHEIYLPPFRASVEAGVGAVMCAYNQVNGVYACENPATLTGWLEGELGFQGWVMSDWGATHSSVASVTSGLDMEMPGGTYLGPPLAPFLASGQIPAARLDGMVRRILTSMFAAGLFDRAPSGSPSADVETAAHRQLVHDAAVQGTVLLQNTGGLLPLDANAIHSIAVVGTAGDASPVFQGYGSAGVTATLANVVTPRQGIASRAGSSISVGYAQGATPPFADATALASQSDVAVVVVGDSSSEGADRTSTSLSGTQNDLVAAVASANPKTIVVTYAPAQVDMPWAGQVAAILFGGLPGQAEGDALAAVLFGDVAPSGKLPFTIAASEADYPVQAPSTGATVTYSEGLLIGYRWFDANAKTPLFPFGHGLSYTTFSYANLVVAPVSVEDGGPVTVTLDVANTGSVAGAEVVELYLGFPTETSEPVSQLEAFQKVVLAPGASQEVSFSLAPSAYSFWSAGRQGPVAYPGRYSVMVGASSRDVRLRGAFDVTGGPLAGTLQPVTSATTSVGIDMPSAGRCAVTARYTAAGAPGSLDLYVNGARAKTVTFPPLANLSTWDFETESVDLHAGVNTVAYASSPGDAGPVDLDAIITCAPPPAGDAGEDGLEDAGIDASASGPSPSAPPNPADVGLSCSAGPPATGSLAALLIIGLFALAQLRRRS